MKKVSLLLVLITTLLSCKKEIDLPKVTSDAKKEYSVSDRTEVYADRMFNTCLNEYVYLNGTAHYFLKVSSDNGYYIDYIIEVKAEGIGEYSGITFKGGGKSVGRVRVNTDGDVKGKVLYDIKYSSSQGNKMGYFQHANFILKNDSVRVEFNNEVPTCE